MFPVGRVVVRTDLLTWIWKISQGGTVIRLPGLLLLTLAVVSLIAGVASSPEEHSSAPSFEDVWPILDKNCVVCHSSDYSESELVLETVEMMLVGGKLSGPALIPGNSAESPMVQYMRGEKEPQMPMGSALAEAEIEMIAAWIDGMAGAAEAETSPEETSDEASEESETESSE